ncbi:hypothetical protein CCR96_16070 [Halochromatium roseum]|nr:hypothetical protein [Halochromatium roseum]
MITGHHDHLNGGEQILVGRAQTGLALGIAGVSGICQKILGTQPGPRRHETISMPAAVALPTTTITGNRERRYPTGAISVAGGRRRAKGATDGDSRARADIGATASVVDLMADRCMSDATIGQGMPLRSGMSPVSNVSRTPTAIGCTDRVVISFAPTPISKRCVQVAPPAGSFVRCPSGIMHAHSQTALIPRSMSATICLAAPGAATKTKALHSVTMRMMSGQATRRSPRCVDVLLHSNPSSHFA